MNTLVEKMFGTIMFLALFVPFQIGLYSSYMDTWEFTQVTTEMTQLIQEEGGLVGKAEDYETKLESVVNEKPVYGYVIEPVKWNPVLNDNKGDWELDPTKLDVKIPVGETITVRYKKDSTGTLGWEPKLVKVTNITVYRR